MRSNCRCLPRYEDVGCQLDGVRTDSTRITDWASYVTWLCDRKYLRGSLFFFGRKVTFSPRPPNPLSSPLFSPPSRLASPAPPLSSPRLSMPSYLSQSLLLIMIYLLTSFLYFENQFVLYFEHRILAGNQMYMPLWYIAERKRLSQMLLRYG